MGRAETDERASKQLSEQLSEAKLYRDYSQKLKDLNILRLNKISQSLAYNYTKKNLKRTENKITKIKSVPLILGQILELIDERTAIVASMSGLSNIVRILSTVDKTRLRPNLTVSLNKHSLAIVDVIPSEAESTISVLKDEERPDVTYEDIGGMDTQKQEMRETVELPLKKHFLYRQIGIDPPRGILLYGPPGTGKTMLVKAVAQSTKASFIKISGSEFIQKYSGEGPRMVRDVFRMAREKAPSIIFIDEVDAVATTRFDSATSADREVQRVLIELLNQMDGFDSNDNVKVIMATNRADTIDPALLRPGRLDRKIEFPLPNKKQKRLIFNAITSKMNLSNVDLESFVEKNDKMSAADIHSVCQEAGMLAIRNSRYSVLMEDFEAAYGKVLGLRQSGLLFYK